MRGGHASCRELHAGNEMGFPQMRDRIEINQPDLTRSMTQLCQRCVVNFGRQVNDSVIIQT